jgi:signal transduction histidine kinase
VTAQEREVRLRVRDDGDTSGTWSVPSPGYGLLGMRERVQLLDGTFEAGPDQRPGVAGGWTVRAVLPRAGQPA